MEHDKTNDQPEVPTTSAKPTTPKKKPNVWRGATSTVLIIVVALVAAFVLTSFVFQSYVVDGESMETTLQNNDRLIIWKVPRTIAKITGNAYVPHRDDVIVFMEYNIENGGTAQNKQLIKRVIGLPGDHVVVKNDKITIYNAQHPNGYDPDANHNFSNNIGSPTLGNIDITVGKGSIFVCGDNRTNSLDSRYFGTVPVKNVIGKLTLRIFPVNNFKSFI